jgi:predicted nucleic acid-binding protein
MNLDQIVEGDAVIIDANIVLYAIQEASGQCKRLLTRCATEEVRGILPVHVLAEVMHRLMLAEAQDYQWIKGQNPARRLAALPERVKSLSRYESLVRDLLGIGLLLEPMHREDIQAALAISRQAGLLTNDALLVAVGQRLRVLAVASADRQFERVQNVILYSPDDLPG